MEMNILKVTALIALIPAFLATLRRTPQRDAVFWSALLVAVFGSLVFVCVRQSAGWHTGLSTALWLTVAACLLLHTIISAFSADNWRLTSLLLPYLFLLGVLAIIWEQAPEQPLAGDAPLAWVGAHIVVSVTTYGLITLAAVAALAAALQEKSLKAKKRTKLSSILPSVAGSENILVRLLISSEIVLFIGLLTGMATLYSSTGKLLIFDHKTMFSIIVLVVVGALLFAHFKSGVRGRSATRLVLLAYLMLTLGYPGVKFVTDILLG